MESSPGAARSARAPPTPTCTVPGLLLGLTKFFSLTKVCAAPTPASDDGNGEAAATTKPRHIPDPDPGPDPRLVLVRLFDAVSALKSGYVKLQRAHFPYDPDKVASADEAVASELDSVAALQCLCTSRRGIGPLVDDRWAQAQRLEADARRRDAHIAALARELRRLQRDNARLSRQVVRSRNENDRGRALLFVPKELATPAALVSQFVAASRLVSDFAELLLGGTGTCSLTAAAAAALSPEHCGVSDDADAEQARSWRRYSLEAHVWRAMLLVGGAGAGDEECYGGGDAGCSFRRIMKPRDAVDALMQFPRSGLSAFCRAAYIAAVPAEAEAAACGNLDHRAFVSRGGHPRTSLYRAFAAAARSVWALRVLMTAVARCSESESGQGGGVRMFYAGRGSPYAAEFMESVAALGAEEARRVEAGEEEKLSVAFTVTPGVKLGDTVVPCRVLLCRRREGFVRIR